MTPETYMRHALDLAQKGRGRVSPNPLVGAVVVHQDSIIGQGWHRQFGGPHAEVHAINAVQDRDLLPESSIYVTLEPCSHHGKTPPCADLIVQSGIKTVYIGMTDPNPQVSGRGIGRMEAAGITVHRDLLRDECRNLNRGFISHFTRNRPYITLKWAQTLDGKIALPDGQSKWITGPDARRRVHAMRALHDGIVTGIGTVLTDDCLLTVRDAEGPAPQRFVLDPNLDIPLKASILKSVDDRPTVLIAGYDADTSKVETLSGIGVTVEYCSMQKSMFNTQSLMEIFNRHGILTLMAEGGSSLCTSFLNAEIVDELAVFVAPKLFGDGVPPVQTLNIASPSEALNLNDCSIETIANDWLITGKLTCLPD